MGRELTAEWGWYQARSEDGSYSGPYATREDAIASGRNDWDGDGFYVAEATNPPVMLSDWIGADYLVERAEDRIFDDYRASTEWDDTIFDPTPEQEKDLIERIKSACDEWQKAHGLTFTSNSFADMRNVEFIPALPEEDQ